MYPYIHITLPSYTILALLGGFFAICFMFFRLEKYEISFRFFINTFVLCVIGGGLGSKVLFALTQITWLIENFSVKNLVLLIPNSGLVYYGGLFGVILSLLFVTKRDASFRTRVLNFVAPAIPLFHSFGRIGCFLTGCCYGKELSAPKILGPFEFTRIPVQLIESFAELTLFFVLCHLEKKRPNVNLLRIYLLSYAVIRFSDEFFRGDEVRGIFGGLSTSQWISIAVIVHYIITLMFHKKTIDTDMGRNVPEEFKDFDSLV